jgi:DNA-binding transcriptional LysR family regulator
MNSQFHSWSDLRVFLAVIEHGSTLAASRAVGLSQPTVARRIDALEHELGLSLFERDTRGFRPTSAALAIVDQAKAVEHAVEAFARAAEVERPERPIRITAFTANLSRRVTGIIGQYSAQHPESTFELLPATATLDLMAGEADIALRITNKTPDHRLICRKISTARFAVYASKSYAERNGIPSGLDDLKEHRILIYSRPGEPSITGDWMLRHVASEKVAKTFPEIELYDAAIRAGQGIGVLNLRMAEDDQRSGELVRCFEPIEDLDMQHIMLVSPAAHRRPEVRRFTKFFAPRYAQLFK